MRLPTRTMAGALTAVAEMPIRNLRRVLTRNLFGCRSATSSVRRKPPCRGMAGWWSVLAPSWCTTNVGMPEVISKQPAACRRAAALPPKANNGLACRHVTVAALSGKRYLIKRLGRQSERAQTVQWHVVRNPVAAAVCLDHCHIRLHWPSFSPHHR